MFTKHNNRNQSSSAEQAKSAMDDPVPEEAKEDDTVRDVKHDADANNEAPNNPTREELNHENGNFNTASSVGDHGDGLDNNDIVLLIRKVIRSNKHRENMKKLIAEYRKGKVSLTPGNYEVENIIIGQINLRLGEVIKELLSKQVILKFNSALNNSNAFARAKEIDDILAAESLNRQFEKSFKLICAQINKDLKIICNNIMIGRATEHLDAIKNSKDPEFQEISNMPVSTPKEIENKEEKLLNFLANEYGKKIQEVFDEVASQAPVQVAQKIAESVFNLFGIYHVSKIQREYAGDEILDRVFNKIKCDGEFESIIDDISSQLSIAMSNRWQESLECEQKTQTVDFLGAIDELDKLEKSLH